MCKHQDIISTYSLFVSIIDYRRGNLTPDIAKNQEYHEKRG
jgi:hypothetical protein